ncbi:hypothetical protein [Thiococcus pfennigii]|uniref:hypothetical protein n=1 Tax=Thiococcus pfennigii TaxID=1057 RepID=UPI001905D633|nr:hypothetical protein [Thiococcus pfennigii]
MNWKKNDPLAAAAYRLVEEELYALALKEVEDGMRRDGLWAKALTDAQFDERQAKVLYMRYRVQSLKDEFVLRAEQNKKNVALANEEDRKNAAFDAKKRERLKNKAKELAAKNFRWTEFEVWFNKTDFSPEVSRFPQATNRMTAAMRGFRVPWPGSPQSTPKPTSASSWASARRTSAKAYSVRRAAA